MPLLVALAVMVVSQLVLHAVDTSAGVSYVVSVGLGIAAVVMLDRKLLTIGMGLIMGVALPPGYPIELS